MGEPDPLITEHSLYTSLGEDEIGRCSHYKMLFDALDIGPQQSEISKATLAGDVYGSAAFHSKVGKLISRATRKAAHGGDRKSELYKNQAG